MDAKKCDRCGVFYIPTNNARVYAISKRRSPSNVELLDICPECYDDLMTFMANPSMVSVYFKAQEEEGFGVE